MSENDLPPEGQPIVLTEIQLKKLVTEGVDDALTRLGVDAGNPIEMQKDFQHLREWREATHAIQKKGLLTIVAILVTGACAALWLGLKGMLQHP